jgi:hypothetical protein
MRRAAATLLSALIFAFTAGNSSYADTFTESIEQAFEDDLVYLSFRYRYEAVDNDASARDATANTLKSSLTLAPRLNDWLFLVQVDDVRHISSDRFNDTRNGKTQYPIVADPEGTGINQAFIRYNGFQDAELTAGRQRINRLNQRFVGGVAWRQNEQTFDSASFAYDNKNFALFYAYVSNVDRLYGPDSGTPPKKLDSDTHLVDGSYTFAASLTITGYGYFMDFEDDAPGFSNQTFGLRATGKVGAAESINVDYQLEYATQDDYGDNKTDYDANYYLLDATLNVSKFGFSAGYEVLGGDRSAGQGFQTPLATLHKFQGWADKFLLTPAAGIEDVYAGATAKLLGGTFGFYYHDFHAESGSDDYGNEIDASALWKIGKYYSVLLKAASFNADSSSSLTDSTKVWLQLKASW